MFKPCIFQDLPVRLMVLDSISRPKDLTSKSHFFPQLLTIVMNCNHRADKALLFANYIIFVPSSFEHFINIKIARSFHIFYLLFECIGNQETLSTFKTFRHKLYTIIICIYVYHIDILCLISKCFILRRVFLDFDRFIARCLLPIIDKRFMLIILHSLPEVTRAY